ncbi:MAG TPA: sulfite exporter TauE/SafE family protein [Bauldia sp.]|nr:sulfite exporter TauE/SafE family protein [Bauldia sp.]
MLDAVQSLIPGGLALDHFAGMALMVFVAALMQGIGGVGFAMMSAPISVLFFPELAPGPLLVLGAGLALLGALREFREVDWKAVAALMSGRTVGTVIAGLTLSILPTTLFSIVFAVLILIGVGFSVAGWRVVANVPNMIAAGLASGIMGTITSSGAPPFAIVMQHVPPPRMRATIGCVFCAGAILSLITLGMVGHFSYAQLWLGILLFPPMMVGFVLSSRLNRYFSREHVRYALLAISALGAIAILVIALTSAAR